MNWWGRCCGWMKTSVLEGRLQRHGYRRLHEEQVAEATVRTRLMIHELADAVIMLRTVADEVEGALLDMEQEEGSR